MDQTGAAIVYGSKRGKWIPGSSGYGKCDLYSRCGAKEDRDTDFEEQEKNALIHAVKFEQEEEIACELTKIIGRIADGKIYSRQCKSYVISVLNSILQVVWSNELEEQRIFEYGTDCYEQVLHMKTTEEVEQFLLKLCCEIHTQLVQRRENMTIDIIKEAKEYIQENYANPELSVEMLCSSLHLSPSYFLLYLRRKPDKIMLPI